MKKTYKLLRAVSLTERKSRYIVAGILTVLLIVVLFLNFPIFQDTRVSTCVGTRTERTGEIAVEPLVQRFVPNGSLIEYIEIHFADCNTDSGWICFSIEDSKGREIYRDTIKMCDIQGDTYYRFETNLSVKRNAVYYFKVYADGMPSWDAPKLWLSNNVKDEIRDVVFRNQPVDRRLQTNVEIGYAQFHYIGFFLSLFSVILAGGTILLQLNIDEAKRRKICLFIMLLMPLVMFIVVESLNSGSAFKKTPIVWIVNYLLYLTIYSLFFFITNRLRFTVLFSNTLIFIIAIVNFYKLEFRGEPFTLSDFASMSTALNVASEYEISLRYMVLTTGCVFMLITAVVSRFRYQLQHKRTRFLLGGVTVALLAFLVTSLFNADRYSASNSHLMQRLGIVNNVWNQPKNFTDNGVLVAITMNAKYLTVSAPSVYNIENLNHVVNDVHENYGINMLNEQPLAAYQRYQEVDSDSMPNIICIMDESYSDFSQFGDINLTQELAPFINSLYDNDNAIRGELYVSTYGGGTANSEFEFLTGNTMLGMPQGSIPYQQYLGSETGSVPRTLHNLGYRTVAIHPYLASGWNRPLVYQSMCFDEFLAIDDFPNPEYVRSYVSDQSSFEKIIEVYEQSKSNDPDQPMFIFNVTMQNHGSYTKTYTNFEPDVFYAASPGSFPEAEQYFSVAHRTDAAVEELIEYFSNCDEPTVICFFGDHLPSLKDGFYEMLFGADTASLEPEQMQKLYMTDFFIWTNYDVNMPDVEHISLNYLSTLVMQVAGIPLTEYQLFLTNIYERFPIITTVGIVDGAGNYVGGTDVVTSTDVWNYYNVLEYNNVFGEDERYSVVFDYPLSIAEEMDYDTATGHGGSSPSSSEVDMIPPESNEFTIETEESEPV